MPCSTLIKYHEILPAKYKKSISNSSLYDLFHFVKGTAKEILISEIILGQTNMFAKVKNN
jgi:hypothetical protein